jgi:hypothetical protein
MIVIFSDAQARFDSLLKEKNVRPTNQYHYKKWLHCYLD